MTTAISVALGHGAKAVDLRVDRQHQRVGGRVCDQGRHDLRSPRPRGQDRDGEAQPGDRPRRHPAPGRGQLRRLPDPRAQAGRGVPHRPGQLGEPGADRGAEDGGLRGGRRARRRPGHPLPAGRQRRQHHRVLAGLPAVPTGLDAIRDRRRIPPGCGASRPPAPRRSCWGTRSTSPRRSRRRSGSGTPPRGHRPRPRATSPVVSSTRSPTSRSSPPTDSSRPRRASSSSPGRPRRSPDLLASHDAGLVPGGARIVCTVTGHGLKDPQWALRQADGSEVVPVRVSADAVSAAVALGLDG